MFPQGYFPASYFHGTYWPKVGAAVLVGDPGTILLSVQANAADLSIDRATLRVSVDEDLGQDDAL